MAYGFTLTVATGAMPSAQGDFAWLAVTSNFPAASIDGGASSILNGGGNLRAYTDSTKAVRVPVEVVTFVTGGTPDIQIWGLSPTLSVASTIYIEADGSATTQPAFGAAFGRNAVWVDYAFVSHGAESDSTGGHTLSATGSPAVVGGNIGSALNVNSSNYYTATPSAKLQLLTQGDFSVQSCVKYETPLFSDNSAIIGQALSSSGKWWDFGVRDDLTEITTDDGSARRDSSNGFDMDTDGAQGVWYLIKADIASTVGYTLFTDSVQESVSTPAAGDCSSTKSLNIGGPAIWTGGAQEIQLDEIRIGEVKGEDYGASEYNNQNNTSTFFTSSAWLDSGGGGLDIDLDSGSLSLIGSALQLLKSSAIAISSGSLNYAGSSLSLLRTKTINIDSGDLSFTGSQLTLTKNSAISLNAGSLSLTGNAVNLLKDSIVNVDSGNLSLTGQNLNLTYSPANDTIINLDTGSISFTGNPLSLTKDGSINLDTGQLTLTGNGLAFLTGKSINLDSGVLSLSGESLELIKQHKLNLDTGNVSLQGKTLALSYSGLIVVEIGDFTVSYTSDTITLDYTQNETQLTYAADGITIKYE